MEFDLARSSLEPQKVTGIAESRIAGPGIAQLSSHGEIYPVDELLALQDLTNRARDSLVSFGERLSTRIFAAFLRHQVNPSCCHAQIRRCSFELE